MKGRPVAVLFAAVSAFLLVFSTSAVSQEDYRVGEQKSTKDTVQGSTSRSSEPDNTGVNKRDRNEGEVTADDASQSSGDIEITRKIRRAIVDNDTLSSAAKNIKVITQNGVVTLKGPVRNARERSTIEAAATSVAGMGKVKNQIEVKRDNGKHEERREEKQRERDQDKSER